VSRQHPYYPLFLDLDGRHVLLAGGGSVSARKAEALLRAGARVTVVAPDVAAELARLAPPLTIVRRPFEASDLDGQFLVFAATNDAAVNARIAEECHARGILVNVADATELCDFIVPAVIERDSVQVALSTGGKSPALARALRRELEAAVGPEWAELNDLLGELRERAIAALPTDADRKRLFDAIVASDALALLREGRREEALATIARLCDAAGVPR
jgi:precorrin-2 dehydrogenase/sirohydrochlorin ferrochelatase